MLTEEQQKEAVEMLRRAKEEIWSHPRYSILAMDLHHLLERPEYAEILKASDDDLFS